MSGIEPGWTRLGESKSSEVESSPSSRVVEFSRKQTTREKSSTSVWLNPELREHEATVNLDDQLPATLYYLGLVKDLPPVVEVYVEELENNRRKHWTVLNERDYGVMDSIYEIEEDTLDRFPLADLSFRVTIQTEDGPSVSKQATKIYDAR